MSPPFLFTIDEIKEHPEAIAHYDGLGNWIPCTDANANFRIGGGVSGRPYYCDRQQIYEVAQLPTGAVKYKQFSTYFLGGYGFWILRGDACSPKDDNWHPLRFDHHDRSYASFVTNAGQHNTLRVQREDQAWAKLLLPDIYHTPMRTEDTRYGGLIGELPIFLALIAFSTSREYLPSVLPRVFSQGSWVVHPYQQPRTDQRGVVVTVYTCPSSYAEGSTAYDLEQYELGNLGKYFH
ncbi:hypothetical protein K491DRAFT_685214 [Lophiostoma macrostomum CBS 122681]|uniref:Uncharacterized protein n=1 Tax=Lophiostoma macrostomum CBS 122681 TaxID=1314788 RepID=A0A6A6SLG3_9PLEO|nr:hypothetical protein K491DRAFT_685214 [Lophiostoma macrostomum CBS 122681]